jgi:hypothetical protein
MNKRSRRAILDRFSASSMAVSASASRQYGAGRIGMNNTAISGPPRTSLVGTSSPNEAKEFA